MDYFTRAIDRFHGQDVYPVEKFRKKTEIVDIKPFVVSLEVTPGDTGLPVIRFSLKTHLNMTMKPEEVLHLVSDMPQEKILDCRIARVYMGSEN